jgi:hypothetical protein
VLPPDFGDISYEGGNSDVAVLYSSLRETPYMMTSECGQSTGLRSIFQHHVTRQEEQRSMTDFDRTATYNYAKPLWSLIAVSLCVCFPTYSVGRSQTILASGPP